MAEPWELNELAEAWGDEFKEQIDFARKSGIPCVDCAWASACVMSGRCAKEYNTGIKPPAALAGEKE